MPINTSVVCVMGRVENRSVRVGVLELFWMCKSIRRSLSLHRASLLRHVCQRNVEIKADLVRLCPVGSPRGPHN